MLLITIHHCTEEAGASFDWSRDKCVIGMSTAICPLSDGHHDDSQRMDSTRSDLMTLVPRRRFRVLFDKAWAAVQTLIGTGKSIVAVHWRRGDQFSSRCSSNSNVNSNNNISMSSSGVPPNTPPPSSSSTSTSSSLSVSSLLSSSKGWQDLHLNCGTVKAFVQQVRADVRSWSESRSLHPQDVVVYIATNEKRPRLQRRLSQLGFLMLKDTGLISAAPSSSSLSSLSLGSDAHAQLPPQVLSVLSGGTALGSDISSSSSSSGATLTSLESFMVDVQFLAHADMMLAYGTSTVLTLAQRIRNAHLHNAQTA